jgi:hypothetical protein
MFIHIVRIIVESMTLHREKRLRLFTLPIVK